MKILLTEAVFLAENVIDRDPLFRFLKPLFAFEETVSLSYNTIDRDSLFG